MYINALGYLRIVRICFRYYFIKLLCDDVFRRMYRTLKISDGLWHPCIAVGFYMARVFDMSRAWLAVPAGWIHIYSGTPG